MSLLKPLILSCKQASLFIQKKEEGALGPWDSFRLKLHLGICAFCRQYEKQSSRLNELLERHFHQAEASKNEDFNAKLKQVIQKKSQSWCKAFRRSSSNE